MDYRETTQTPPGWKADHIQMILIDENEEVSYKAAYVVCPTCDGKGKHVNPAIDSHGISQEEFDEDPEFRSSYFSGHYDIPCNGCEGRRVILEPYTKEGLREYNQAWEDEWNYRAECEAERRMGC